jgi:hypothetical protein
MGKGGKGLQTGRMKNLTVLSFSHSPLAETAKQERRSGKRVGKRRKRSALTGDTQRTVGAAGKKVAAVSARSQPQAKATSRRRQVPKSLAPHCRPS